ncbi:histidine phosphatase family protein [Virgibacillus halophilus]|uniref:histidine phosphatase family protein n=1 Tax=Tigheibacillus halophilus TaxID=361280 RepID=UPI0036365FCB
MQTDLYLVRHAHSIYTPDEVNRPLSEKGMADAQRVAAIFHEQKIDHIYASPYKRAVQTVEGIAVFRGKKVQIEKNFRERKLAGKPVVDFDYAIRKVWDEPSFSWEGGESNIAAQARGVDAILRLLEWHMDQRIVVGTHGNIMVLIMQYFDQKYGFDFWDKLGMPDVYRLCFHGLKLADVQRCW